MHFQVHALRAGEPLHAPDRAPAQHTGEPGVHRRGYVRDLQRSGPVHRRPGRPCPRRVMDFQERQGAHAHGDGNRFRGRGDPRHPRRRRVRHRELHQARPPGRPGRHPVHTKDHPGPWRARAPGGLPPRSQGHQGAVLLHVPGPCERVQTLRHFPRKVLQAVHRDPQTDQAGVRRRRRVRALPGPRDLLQPRNF